MKKIRFIIYSPPYNENNGGAIALHKLCHLLNAIGYKAYFYSQKTPKFSQKKYLLSSMRLALYSIKAKFKPRTNPNFNTPVISHINKQQDIIIYPEIIDGNPLRAKKVVRWFLHEPGYHTGIINYGENELYFYFQKSFNDPNINKDWNNKLRVLYLFNDIYKQVNFGDRRGTCHILRKGAHKQMVHDTSDSILIDNLPHEKIAEIFNQVEMCISYDTKTLYSQYAVMCGCKSVLIPDKGVCIEKWQPEVELRSGVAYGFNDIPRAEATKEQLLDILKEEEKESVNDVKRFAKKCFSFFKT